MTPEGSHSGQFGQSGNLYPPGLIIGEGNVKAVKLIIGHGTYEALNTGNRMEIPTHIQHLTPVSKYRFIKDINTSYFK